MEPRSEEKAIGQSRLAGYSAAGVAARPEAGLWLGVHGVTSAPYASVGTGIHVVVDLLWPNHSQILCRFNKPIPGLYKSNGATILTLQALHFPSITQARGSAP